MARPNMSKKWGRGPADCEWWDRLWEREARNNLVSYFWRPNHMIKRRKTACQKPDGNGSTAMSKRKLFQDVWRNNKKTLMIMAAFGLIFPALNCLGVIPVYAGEEAKETATLLGGSFAASLITIIGEGYFSGIDTAWTMIIIAVASIVSKIGAHTGISWLQNRFGFTFGIFDNLVICIVMLVWFGVPIILKCFSKTNPFGVALESKLKKYNGILLAVVAVSQMVTGPAIGEVSVSSASLPGRKILVASSAAGSALPGSSKAGSGMGFWGTGATVAACIAALAICLVIYYLVRYLFSLLDIVMVPICTFVPCASELTVFGKLLLVIFMLLIAVYLPGLFVFFFTIIMIAAVLLFRTAVIACRYIESIYGTPLLKKIFGGYNRKMPLRAKKVPRRLRTLLESEQPDLFIPVFILKKIPGVPQMRKWDRWWLVSRAGEQYLVKPQFMKNECTRILLTHKPQQKIFINQFLFYHEIFTVSGEEDDIFHPLKRIPKRYHLVFSKEYFYRYQEIREFLGYTDLAEYRKMRETYQPQKKKQGFFSKFRKEKMPGAEQ